MHYQYVIIGGGIAGMTCLETLSQLTSDESILLISASPVVKVISNYRNVTDNLQDFDVSEAPLSGLPVTSNVSLLHDAVLSLDVESKTLSTMKNKSISFDCLCICTGAHPKLFCDENEYVIGIRDTESVTEFQKKLSSAKRIVIVGNGGIATELVYEINNCEVVWVIKDDSIISTFVDCGAAEFFLKQLSVKDSPSSTSWQPTKHLKYTITADGSTKGDHTTQGSALGPNWLNELKLQGTYSNHERMLHIEYNVDNINIFREKDISSSNTPIVNPFVKEDLPQKEDEWPVFIELNNKKLIGCDVIVSATGVIPNSQIFSPQLHLAEDGGITINETMQTSCPYVYAAGDVSTATWNLAPHWLQMRLWTQARQQGHYAAKCMVAHTKGETIHMDFCFDLFAHVTKFFNFKVILLGRFNSQGLGNDYTLLLRVTEGVEYVKAVLKDGRLQGAILIGETDLEETFENLILNQTDLSRYGDELLDPNIDIEDYFD